MSDEGSRADRLRRRREQQRDQQTNHSQQTDVSDSFNPSKQNETDETNSENEPTSVKDDRVGTYMYLPENQRTELDFTYKELSLTYERAFGEELEKNRHFYPLLVKAGLERLDGLDSDDIRDRLDQLED